MQAKAEQNLQEQILAAAPIAFRVLLDLAQHAQSEAVRKDAAKDLFDRAGFGATMKQALAVSRQDAEASELDVQIQTLLGAMRDKEDMHKAASPEQAAPADAE